MQADRHGVRDCLRVVLRQDSREGTATWCVILYLLASPPLAGVAPVPVMDIPERALRRVQGHGLQATRAMS